MNGPKPKAPRVSNKDPFLTPAKERMWGQVVEYVRRAPATGLALDYETQVQLLLISLGIDSTPEILNVVTTSAIEGESLSWLISRIAHEYSKS
jgi:hypothetical protein